MDQVDEALEFIKKHMQVEYVIADKLERDEVWDYPLEALREGLMNAVCHRDYGDLADIQIKIFDEALQIWSPGFLPFGMTVEELLEPSHSSKPRNRLIAQAFYDMGMIEQYGSGIGRVINACKAANLAEPEFGNFSGGFRILFKPQVSGPESRKVAGEVTGEVAGEVTGEVIDVLRALSGQPLTRLEVQAALGLKSQANFRARYLKPALEEALVEMTIPDKPNSRLQKYRLTEEGKALLKNSK